ncbi:MAG TPA: response regulator [Deltaproteobacteria bacterium]|nr:response regulator [Deltaproteobacteria bacterium]
MIWWITSGLGLGLGLGLASPSAEGPGAEQFGWSHWDLASGLPQSSVTELGQLSDGTLAFGTFAGLVRFDGLSFDVLGIGAHPDLDDVRFTAVEVGADDVLWIGSQHGSVFSLDQARLSPSPPGPRGVIWDLLERDGTVWAAASDGLWALDRSAWRFVPGTGPLRSLARLDGALIAAGDLGSFRVSDAGVEPLGGPALAGALAPDPEREVLWVSASQALAILDGDTWATIPLPTSAQILALHLDRDGGLWISRGERLLRWDVEEILDAVRASEPPPDGAVWSFGSPIRDLFGDSGGALWVGTDHLGLFRATPHAFTSFGREQGLPSRGAGVVLAYDDTVLVGSGCGSLVRLEGDTFVPWVEPLSCVRALARASDGGLWIGHGTEILHHDGPTDRSGGTVPAWVLALHEAPDETLWIGTAGEGAFTLRRGRIEPVPLPRERWISAIEPGPDGSLWFAGHGGIAVRSVDGSWSHLGPEDGLPRAVIRAIHHTPSETWLGSYGGGLIRIRDGAIARISTAQHLQEDVVSWILEDDGSLWLGGNRGVSRVSLAELNAVADGALEKVTARLFPSGEGNGGSAPGGAVGADGRLWFPTIEGVVAIDPDAILPPSEPPVARIEGVEFNGERFEPGDLSELPPGMRDLTFYFGASILDHPELGRFVYRLWPEQDWIRAGSRRYAHYAGLKPGLYRFEVRAMAEGGDWSEIAAAQVVLEPSWSETWSFRLFVILVGLLAGGGGYRWRTATIRYRNEALRREVESRRASEEVARLNEAHYRGLFQASTEGLVVVSNDGEVILANPAAEQILGVGTGGLAGVRVDELFVEIEGMTYGAAGGEPGRPVRISPQVPFGEGQYLITLSDLKQLTDLQERLARSERLEAIGRLAGGVAHDFNNLLTALRGNAAVLQGLLAGAEPDAVICVEEIIACADRGTTLTRQLLAFGRRQLLRPRVVDLVEFIEASLPFLQRLLRDNIVLRARLEVTEPVVVRVDPSHLENALFNLVINACDAMPGGGAVTITLGVDPGEAILAVSDEGQGISEEVLPHIFEPFFSTRGGSGSGLGLASVHGFVTQSGGGVRVTQGRSGVGTRFEMRLPLDSATPNLPERTSPPELPLSGTERLLLIDDDDRVRRTLRRCLQQAGYEVLEAADGYQALELLKETQLVLMITDLLMPGMNGVQVAEQARALHPGIGVIYMSGYTDDVLPEREAMHQAFLPKPFLPEELLAVVRRVLDGG